MRIVNIRDEEYPELLRAIKNPPVELFVNGRIIPSDRNAVAIVGTRRATYYGLQQCEKIAYDLAERGVTIVSGMARGIDSSAHRGALKAGGRTIAVMGTGHDQIYPSENRKLYDEISQSGAVISQFPIKTEPMPFNFPMRNRIISGLSRGVLVIEAPEKSGALITADYALEQNREVFGMPGNISSSKSSGTNALIKDGAKLVQDSDDILDELKNVLDPEQVRFGALESGDNARAQFLSEDERSVFCFLGDIPKGIDEIAAGLNVPINKVSGVLLALEIKKLTRALPGKNFVKT